MIRSTLWSLGLFCLLATGSFAANHGPLHVPPLAYEKYTLPNGLEVILHEDRRLPLVALDVWYHVGPRNEVAGRTGFAHLFEHMMFEGSEHVGEKAHFRYLEGVGATGVNGTTDFDRTNYFETLPSNQLEMGLWLESDRMGFLLESLDRQRLTNQRDVVRNERRQGEGTPYQLAQEEEFHLLFPKDHPYYASVIGSHADIEAARLLEVRDFHQQFYTPNNATIAIAGDFDSAKIKPLLAKYFGPIPRGPEVAKVNIQAQTITAERRATVTDTVQLPRISVAWLTAPAFATGDAEAQVLSEILGGGHSSRFYQSLVYRKQIAQDVHCETDALALQSVSTCDVTARPQVKPEDLEAAMNQELEQLRNNGPTEEEVERARNVILSRKITQLQRLGGFGGIADTLDLYNQYLGDPGYLPKDVARFEAVTVASVKSTAESRFMQNQRVTVYTVAGKKVLNDVPRSPDSTDAEAKVVNPYSADFEAQQKWRDAPPKAGPTPKLNLPVPTVTTLSNGLKLYLVENHSLPVINVAILDLAGGEANPLNRPGLSDYTARMLTQGTEHRSATQIANDTDLIGAHLTASADEDKTTASIGMLSTYTQDGLELLSDIVEHPRFDPQEIDRVRKEQLANIMQEADEPFSVALRVAQKVVFGDSPYAYRPTGTVEAVQAISRDDVASFWKSYYRPQNAALVLSGDITAQQAKDLAERYFSGWKGSPDSKSSAIPLTPATPQHRIVIVDKPGAPQTALVAMGIGLPRNTPDYAATEVMNSILGGLFSSRINMNLREKHGYTYGASSFYRFRRGAGPFMAAALVRTDVTGPAAGELVHELQDLADNPPTAAELALARNYELQSLPGQFETVRTTSGLIGDLFVYSLPVDYYRTLPGQYDSLTPEAVNKAARDHVHPSEMVIVAVGDKAKIESGLKKLGEGGIELRDSTGKLVNASQ